ncbi:hypothetical protein PSAC2689_30475 [Paraburkholderia sacchari]
MEMTHEDHPSLLRGGSGHDAATLASREARRAVRAGAPCAYFRAYFCAYF